MIKLYVSASQLWMTIEIKRSLKIINKVIPVLDS